MENINICPVCHQTVSSDPKCPSCHQPVLDRCEVSGCLNYAEFEGWWAVKDVFNKKTGLIQRRQVCKDHVYLLKGKLDDKK